MNIDNLPEILTLTQVCEILNVHPNTLRNWDKNGQLRAMRIGVKRIRRYKKDSIMNFLKDMENAKEKN
ncbi:MAG: helix-turn-helix domain-containing protein [Candidatus Nanogingivalaceae bacterium]|jgi:DNA binding domain, excisionase family|nr:helix-turn-helix domain-containing protein [Candidatus Nanogingivalaceae bacterium]